MDEEPNYTQQLPGLHNRLDTQMYLTNLVLICVVEANGPAILLISRAQVALKVLGSTPFVGCGPELYV
jgi:hypothetical protein